MDHFGRVAKIAFDVAANEAFIADGYGHKRVAVIDMTTGKIKRFWGAYGNVPSDSNLGRYEPSAPPAQQFRNPVHCAQPSNDGLVYVCDRPNDRITGLSQEWNVRKGEDHWRPSRGAMDPSGTSRFRATPRRSTSISLMARTRRST